MSQVSIDSSSPFNNNHNMFRILKISSQIKHTDEHKFDVTYLYDQRQQNTKTNKLTKEQPYLIIS